MKISTVVCGFSPIQTNYSNSPKCIFNRINEVYAFSTKYRYSDLIEKKHLNFDLVDFTYWRLWLKVHVPMELQLVPLQIRLLLFAEAGSYCES